MGKIKEEMKYEIKKKERVEMEKEEKIDGVGRFIFE